MPMSFLEWFLPRSSLFSDTRRNLPLKSVTIVCLTLLRHLLEQDDGSDDAVGGHGDVRASRLRVGIELDGPSLELDSGRSCFATSHFYLNESRREPRGGSLFNEKWFQTDLDQFFS